MSEYFTRSNHQTIVSRPLEVVNRSSEFDIRCKVKGGGVSAKLAVDEVVKYEDLIK